MEREDFEVYSDGTSLLTLENKYIHHFGKGNEYSIENILMFLMSYTILKQKYIRVMETSRC
jgi:hypothetical protein